MDAASEHLREPVVIAPHIDPTLRALLLSALAAPEDGTTLGALRDWLEERFRPPDPVAPIVLAGVEFWQRSDALDHVVNAEIDRRLARVQWPPEDSATRKAAERRIRRAFEAEAERAAMDACADLRHSRAWGWQHVPHGFDAARPAAAVRNYPLGVALRHAYEGSRDGTWVRSYISRVCAANGHPVRG